MDWLRDARSLAADEPEWDRAILEFLPYSGVPPAQSFAEAQSAIRRHPDYLPLLTTAVWYVGEDWHGSREMVERLMHEAVTAAPTEGRANYARVYWFLNDDMFHGAIFTETGVRWSEMKSGFEDLVAAWPDAWNLNAYAYFACLKGDRETLSALLTRIGEDVVPPVWGSTGVAQYELCKRELAGP